VQKARPVVRWNEVSVLRVAADVAGHEGAARDHREVPGACVLEGKLRHLAGDPVPLQGLRYDRVDEDDAVAQLLIGDDGELARCAYDTQQQGTDERWTDEP
jgi:hypothetical protein